MDQLKLQASRHAAHLERLKSGYVKEFEPFLRRMKKVIGQQLGGEVITEFTRTRLGKQLKTINKLLLEPLQDYETVLLSQIKELADYEVGFEVRSLENVVQKVSFALPSATQLNAAVFATPLMIVGPDNGKLLESFIKDFTTKEATRVSNILRAGAAQGQTTSEVIRIMRNNVDVSSRNAETIARTALQHTAVQARESTFSANSDLVEFVQWSSILDGKTSIQCQSLSNQKFKLNEGPRPPAHPRCRSSMVPVLRAPYDRLSRGGEQKARAPYLEDGELKRGPLTEVPATQTYYDFLKNQPAAVQNSIIGPTRAKLLRNGGITSQRFAELQLDKNFMPLKTIVRDGKNITPLMQMRELDPIAFLNANIPD
jgi:SPP1 gp7 family putative phage head morphogenesis protein